MPRVQSPSSINTFKQCARKYFYQYIVKLPTKPSIHLIRGSIVHEVLEKFFEIDIKALDPDDYKFGLRSFITASFVKRWKHYEAELKRLGLSNDDLEQYLIDSIHMLNNFIENFCLKLKEKITIERNFEAAFKSLTPAVEEEIQDAELSVRGFIDAIHAEEDITIMDYKTSNKDEITPQYRLQLLIYALLYKLKYGVTPKKVGINFLKFGERMLDIDESMLEDARSEIIKVHELTQSDQKKDYQKNITKLCPWCDFYEFCRKDT